MRDDRLAEWRGGGRYNEGRAAVLDALQRRIDKGTP